MFALRWILPCATSLVLLAAAAVWKVSPGATSGRTPILATVKRLDFRKTLTESGALESARNTDVRSLAAGKEGKGLAIKWLIDQGTLVVAGDRLIELDGTALRDAESQQLIAYEQARAGAIKATATRETAEISVEEFASGVFVQDLATIETEIAIAQANYKRAADYAAFTNRLYLRGFSTKEQLEADTFGIEKARLELRVAETKKLVLERYKRAKTVKQLAGELRSLEAEEASKLASLKVEESKLKLIQAQIARCEILAPTSGQVVYARLLDDKWQEVPLKTGFEAREGQVLIHLPDLTSMRVKVRVNESRINMLKVGHSAEIRVRASADSALVGTVTEIDPLPLARSWNRGDVREFGATVTIENPPADLRPGMTADVTILARAIPQALVVPIQAVQSEGKQSFCVVPRAEGGYELRAIEIAETSDAYIVVKGGLEEGEQVVLEPRKFLDRENALPVRSPAEKSNTRFVE